MNRQLVLEPDCDKTEPLTDDSLLEHCGLGIKRLRAHRLERGDLPWLSGVKLPWGLEVRLLNISKSGLLVESHSKLTGGASTAFHLWGPNKTLTLPARIVRCQVGRVDGRGVTYQAAAVFDKDIDLLERRPTTLTNLAAAPKALAELLVRVMIEHESGADSAALRTTFEQGVGLVVGAQTIEIRIGADGPDYGSTHVIVPVLANRGFDATLEAKFGPDGGPGEEQVRALTAAAILAAFLLQFEGVSLAMPPEANTCVNDW
jgi:hypothetical protein